MWGAIGVTVAGMASVVIGIPVNGLMLLTIGVLAILIGAPVAGTLMLDSWRANHGGGQLPPQRIQAPAGEPYDTIGDGRTISEARNDIRNRLYPLGPGPDGGVQGSPGTLGMAPRLAAPLRPGLSSY
jgi:hypothetical protein